MLFDEALPEYLVMGMTAEQFWDGDCALVKYFRQAYRIRKERENESAWLQGMYFYNALSSVIGQAFAKKGTIIDPYPDKPYEIYKKKKTQAEIEAENTANAVAYMQEMTARFNRSFEARKKE